MATLTKSAQMPPTRPGGDAKPAAWRDAAALAKHVQTITRGFPQADRDWITDPIRHAAQALADRIAAAWAVRRQPAMYAAHLAVAEADAAEVQTWALLAMRHHLLPPAVADDVDRRCEAILDALADMSHKAHRWAGPAAAKCRAA